jgi:hypothetical protein
MKKFELLGKSLTRDEQKRVQGGNEAVDPGSGGACVERWQSCCGGLTCCSGLSCISADGSAYCLMD